MPAEKSNVAIHISTMESAVGLELLNLLNGRIKPLKERKREWEGIVQTKEKNK